MNAGILTCSALTLTYAVMAVCGLGKDLATFRFNTLLAHIWLAADIVIIYLS